MIEKNMLKHTILIIALTSLVIAVTLYGFISGGSPFEIRNNKLDQGRVTKIQSLSMVVDQYFQKNQRLPQTLDDIYNNDQSKNHFMYSLDYFKDPGTNNVFEYLKNGELSYNICTSFSSDPPKNNLSAFPTYNGSDQKYSSYKKGRYCFDYSVESKDLSYVTPFPTPFFTPTPTPQISNKEGITNFKKDDAPYVRIIGTLVGIPGQSKFQLSTQNGQSDPLVVTVLYEINTVMVDKQNLPVKVSKFTSGDKILIESNVMRGQNNYEAKYIQNLTK